MSAAKNPFPWIIAIALLCLGQISYGKGQKDPNKDVEPQMPSSVKLQKRSPTPTPTRCTASIGLVTPDFVVLPGPSKVTVFGACFNTEYKEDKTTHEKSFLQELSLFAEPLPSPAAVPTAQIIEATENKITVDLQFSSPGRFTLCPAKKCVWGTGPIIQVVAAATCSAVDPDAGPIATLESEQEPNQATVPVVAECTPPIPAADLGIIVDSPTSVACIALKEEGSFSCAKKQNKKALQLKSGDTAVVYVENKNPFRETYKFSTTDQQIKDDDIGSFLSLLVPSLGGGSSKSSDKGGGSVAPSNAAKDNVLAFLKPSSPLNPESFFNPRLVENRNAVESNEAKLEKPKLSWAQVESIHDTTDEFAKKQNIVKNELDKTKQVQSTEAEKLPPEEQTQVSNLQQSAEEHLQAADEHYQEQQDFHQQIPEPSDEEKTKLAPASAKQKVRKEADESLKRSDDLQRAFDQLAEANRLLEQAKRSAQIRVCTRSIRQRVDDLVYNYHYFATTYNEIRNQLVKTVVTGEKGASCEELRGRAIALWELANAENEKILQAQVNFNLRDLSAFLDGEKAAIAQEDANTSNKDSSPTATLKRDKRRQSPSQPQAGSDTGSKPAKGSDDNSKNDPRLAALQSQANGVKTSICILKAMHTEVAPVLPDGMAAIESVLTNPHSFISAFQIGPYADATQVDWTLTRTVLKPVVGGISVAKFNSDIDDCISTSSPKPGGDTTTPKKSGDSSTSLREEQTRPAAMPAMTGGRVTDVSFRLPMQNMLSTVQQKSDSKQSGSKKDSSGGDSSNTDSSSQSPGSSDDSNRTTRGKRINFGSERFIVSIGLTGAAFSQQEFGKAIGEPQFDTSGNALMPPQAVTTVVVQKNDSSFRLSPMAFLNTRIYQPTGWVNATYATFGITAKSDSPGVRPEYMLGASQSFWERHVLLTLGVYMGQQSTLAGGLKVNQALPSNLTNDLPLNSPYRFRFGAALSWRVPGLSK